MNGENTRMPLGGTAATSGERVQNTHSLSAVDRGAITVRGVNEVLSFDESNVALVTVCGQLTLEGEDLRVTVLNTKDGVVEVTGKLNGLLYFDETSGDRSNTAAKSRSGRFGRFFR